MKKYKVSFEIRIQNTMITIEIMNYCGQAPLNILLSFKLVKGTSWSRESFSDK